MNRDRSAEICIEAAKVIHSVNVSLPSLIKPLVVLVHTIFMLTFGSSKSCSGSGLVGGIEAEVGKSCEVPPDIDTFTSWPISESGWGIGGSGSCGC